MAFRGIITIFFWLDLALAVDMGGHVEPSLPLSLQSEKGMDFPLTSEWEPPRTLPSKKYLELKEKFNKRQTALISGTATECAFVGTRYNLSKADGSRETYSFYYPENIEKYRLPLHPDLEQVAMFHNRSDKRSYLNEGLAVQIRGQWYLVRPKTKMMTNEVVSLGDQVGSSAIFDFRQLFDKFLESGAKSTQDIEVVPFLGNADMSELSVRSGEGFSLDDNGALAEYVDQHAPVTGTAKLLEPNVKSLRIPRGMYELLKTPEYRQAGEERNYSKQYDLIYQKALSLFPGDHRKALFASLIAVDLRDRGPCGAVYGLRGRGLVPKSIFDLEKPEANISIGNRFDAAQHFFGYALTASDVGGTGGNLYSRWSKSQAMKKLGMRFREMHSGSNPDTGEDVDAPGLSSLIPKLTGNPDLKVRPNWDHESDLHYNRLGVAFHEALAKDPKVLPSQVITSPEWSKYDSKMKLATDRSKEWVSRGYLPEHEIPLLVAKIKKISGIQVWVKEDMGGGADPASQRQAVELLRDLYRELKVQEMVPIAHSDQLGLHIKVVRNMYYPSATLFKGVDIIIETGNYAPVYWLDTQFINKESLKAFVGFLKMYPKAPERGNTFESPRYKVFNDLITEKLIELKKRNLIIFTSVVGDPAKAYGFWAKHPSQYLNELNYLLLKYPEKLKKPLEVPWEEMVKKPFWESENTYDSRIRQAKDISLSELNTRLKK